MPRFHLSIAVTDLAPSLDFYRRLFGRDPDYLAEDYAKWLLDEPRVNVSIRESATARGLDHVGLEGETPAELATLRERFSAAGLAGVEESGAICCHARSDKTWLEDPDGVAWESFYTHEQLPAADNCCRDGAQAGCCA